MDTKGPFTKAKYLKKNNSIVADPHSRIRAPIYKNTCIILV